MLSSSYVTHTKQRWKNQLKQNQIYTNIWIYNILGINWVWLIIPLFTITRVIYMLLVINYFTRFIWTKNYLKYTADKVVDIYKNHNFLIFDHSKMVYSDKS